MIINNIVKKGKSEWKTHEGEKYLYISFASLIDTEAIALTSIVSKQLGDMEENSVRIITDLRDLEISVNLYSFMRVFSKKHQKYLFKSAIIGITERTFPFYKIYKKVTNTKAQLCETKVEAIDYIFG